MKEIKKLIRLNKRLHGYLKENEVSMQDEYEKILRRASKMPSELRQWLCVIMQEEE